MSMDIIDDLLFEAGFDDALISHSLAGLIQIEVRRSAETEYMLTESIICSSSHPILQFKRTGLDLA